MTKNNVDMIYDKIIMRVNPMYYNYGTMEYIKFYGYNTQDSHMLRINKIEQCYVQKRLIFDDGDWEILNEHLIIWVNGMITWLIYVMKCGKQENYDENL